MRLNNVLYGRSLETREKKNHAVVAVTCSICWRVRPNKDAPVYSADEQSMRFRRTSFFSRFLGSCSESSHLLFWLFFFFSFSVFFWSSPMSPKFRSYCDLHSICFDFISIFQILDCSRFFVCTIIIHIILDFWPAWFQGLIFSRRIGFCSLSSTIKYLIFC